ncbi:MAG: glycosyl transferase, group 1 family protein [Cyanobacteria bacterium RYN_339]|nr:glycosyl transferase, group 1 family protein [Cyanobacteria bacterium RYN_339]
MTMKTSLVLLLNPVTNDSRVLKECTTLGEHGYRVHLFALQGPGLPAHEEKPFGEVRRFRAEALGNHKVFKLLKAARVAVSMIAAARQVKPDVVHANDLETLPIGYAIAKLCGAKLIYDSHELWRDSGNRAAIPGWIYAVAMGLERGLAPKADGVITVSAGIADDMAKHLGIPLPTLVRNVPWPRAAVPGDVAAHPLRTNLGLAPEVPIVLYQGRMAPGYGVEHLLEAMQWVDEPTMLVYLGFGPLREPLEERARALGLAHRVKFHDAVPPEVLVHYSADATVGACPSQGTCTSYIYSLPNKFFEFIQAGLPVVASDLPELRALVAHYELGATFPNEDAPALARTLNALLGDPARLEACRAGVRRAAAELHWQNEETQLVQLYHRVCPVA